MMHLENHPQLDPLGLVAVIVLNPLRMIFLFTVLFKTSNILEGFIQCNSVIIRLKCIFVINQFSDFSEFLQDASRCYSWLICIPSKHWWTSFYFARDNYNSLLISSLLQKDNREPGAVSVDCLVLLLKDKILTYFGDVLKQNGRQTVIIQIAHVSENGLFWHTAESISDPLATKRVRENFSGPPSPYLLIVKN